MITTPKQSVTGLLQAVEWVKHDPADPLYGQCKHFNIFQGNAKSVAKTALAWKAAGKINIWIELASTLESALNPEMKMFHKPGQTQLSPRDLGREDARRGYPVSHNPYTSDAMRAEWLAGWSWQQLRIQRKCTRGWRMPANAIYVGRSSRWSNPYIIGQPSVDLGGELVTNANWLPLFEGYCERMLTRDPHWLDPLLNMFLACWCPLEQPCHIDVILRLLSARFRAFIPRVSVVVGGALC